MSKEKTLQILNISAEPFKIIIWYLETDIFKVKVIYKALIKVYLKRIWKSYFKNEILNF